MREDHLLFTRCKIILLTGAQISIPWTYNCDHLIEERPVDERLLIYRNKPNHKKKFEIEYDE